MYNDIAPFYDRLYNPFKDYAKESARLRELIAKLHPQAGSVLDIGCGTGTHLSHLQDAYAVAGVDISPGLLEVARTKYPGIPFHLGNMLDFDLGRRFDVITCLFGSIGYVRDVAGLRRAAANFARHLAPGGLLLIEPWLSPETFKPGTITHNVVNDDDMKASWMYVARREEGVSVFDIHYLVGTVDGVVHSRDLQILGLFRSEEYLECLHGAGLKVLEQDPHGFHGYGLFQCRK
jgi:SAM-dependent methyltransferase